jgi:hypothetical protein
MTPDAEGLRWFKSTYSDAGNDCVETAFVEDSTLVRDTKDREGPVLRFPRNEWTAFLEGVKDGQFDPPE